MEATRPHDPGFERVHVEVSNDNRASVTNRVFRCLDHPRERRSGEDLILRGDIEFAREVGGHKEQRSLDGWAQVPYRYVDFVAHKADAFRLVPVEQLKAA